MPLYEYECDACGHRFEVIRKFSDQPLDKCPTCGGSVRKLQSAPAFQFKGSGFYITDYPKKDQSGGKDESSSQSSGEKKDGASAKGDTKDSGAEKRDSGGDKKDGGAEKKDGGSEKAAAGAKSEKPSEKSSGASNSGSSSSATKGT